MPTSGERILAALQLVLRASHLAGPDDLPELVSSAARELGSQRATVYLADYDEVLLVPFQDGSDDGSEEVAEPVPVEGTLAGRAFTEVLQQVSVAGPGPVLWNPVVDGTARVGVLQLEFPAGAVLDEELQAGCLDVADLVAELVITRRLYGDAIERVRRRADMTIPAEMQWGLLPPLTFVGPRVAITGVLAPAMEVGGDTFDYAMNGDTLHVAVLDAMGHGLEAALLSAVAVGTLRNSRRGELGLAQTVRRMDAELASQFGGDRFVTGVVGRLDLSTGWWEWTTCGHPPTLLVRAGRVVKTLDQVNGVPLGLGLLAEQPEIGRERLEPGDRLLLFTDGVIEARDQDGTFFGTDRLVEFVSREAAAGRPAAETMRRLNLAILAHQEGTLQDDATTVMVEWLTDEPEHSTMERSTP